MNYARLDPEFVRKGYIHSEVKTDIEMLAYDLARLGCKWPKVHRIIRSLMIQNLKARHLTKSQIAERIGLDKDIVGGLVDG